MRARTLIPILCLLMFFFSLAPAAWPAPVATVQHLTVQLVVPPAEIYPGQNLPRASISSSNRAGMCTGSTLVIPASPAHQVVAAGRNHSRRDAVPAPKRLPLGPLMDFGYENEVLFPIPMHVGSAFKPDG